MATAGSIIREVPCPECEDSIQVEFVMEASIHGGQFSTTLHVVGSPIADHICERHPNLLD